MSGEAALGLVSTPVCEGDSQVKLVSLRTEIRLTANCLGEIFQAKWSINNDEECD